VKSKLNNLYFICIESIQASIDLSIERLIGQ
jgi:hypothetical protein